MRGGKRERERASEQFEVRVGHGRSPCRYAAEVA
jgi:hypothetical protein